MFKFLRNVPSRSNSVPTIFRTPDVQRKKSFNEPTKFFRDLRNQIQRKITWNRSNLCILSKREVNKQKFTHCINKTSTRRSFQSLRWFSPVSNDNDVVPTITMKYLEAWSLSYNLSVGRRMIRLQLGLNKCHFFFIFTLQTSAWEY